MYLTAEHKDFTWFCLAPDLMMKSVCYKPRLYTLKYNNSAFMLMQTQTKNMSEELISFSVHATTRSSFFSAYFIQYFTN